MSSPASQNGGRAEIAPDDDTGTPFSTPLAAFPSCRTIFYSSGSVSFNSSHRSSSSSRDDSPLFSPSSTPRRYSGIPFSWEKLPGIPKKQLSKKYDPSLNLLPLPPAPAGTPTPPSSKRYNSHEISSTIRKKCDLRESFRRDPFFAALVECSRDHHDDDQDSVGTFFQVGSKVTTRTLSDLFGFLSTYTSCKRNCHVSKSIIYVPRPR